MTTTDPRARIGVEFEARRNAAAERLAHFAESLPRDPQQAMEWSGTTFNAAAELHVAGDVLELLGTPTAPGLEPEALARLLLEELVTAAADGTSSACPAANLARSERRLALARAFAYVSQVEG